MHTPLARLSGFALLLLIAVGSPPATHSAGVIYTATLTGPNESPPNASPGIGSATVEIDAVAHTMRVQASFSGLLGNTSASHIHAATAVAGTGTVGVATMLPSFAGFPLGVTAGTYDVTFDMTQASSYNPSYITNNGGTAASAEAALFLAIADGKAYFNVHSVMFPGGEIRGFLLPANPTPTDDSTWGRVKALYR